MLSQVVTKERRTTPGQSSGVVLWRLFLKVGHSVAGFDASKGRALGQK